MWNKWIQIKEREGTTNQINGGYTPLRDWFEREKNCKYFYNCFDNFCFNLIVEGKFCGFWSGSVEFQWRKWLQKKCSIILLLSQASARINRWMNQGDSDSSMIQNLLKEIRFYEMMEIEPYIVYSGKKCMHCIGKGQFPALRLTLFKFNVPCVSLSRDCSAHSSSSQHVCFPLSVVRYLWVMVVWSCLPV